MRKLEMLSRIWISCFLINISAQTARSADLQHAVAPQENDIQRGPSSFGIYGGALYKQPFISLFYAPTKIHLSDSYIVALNFDYRFYSFKSLPLAFEGEFNIAKRLGAQDQFDVSVAPFARWTEFPWNRIVYTNVRVGLAGFSYVTSISPFERQNSGNGVGSRILHFLAPEVTFARSETAKGEAFFRVHHRSGVYGLFNGVKGGSNYLSGGYRMFY